LMAHYRQSKRRTALFLESVLNIPCSTGLVVKLQNRATQSLRPIYDQLVSQLPTQSVLGIDETPMKQANSKSWLWAFVAKQFSVFQIRPTRASGILADLLTDKFAGIVTCDRAKMYWKLNQLQWCWAHLKRDFQKMADNSNSFVKELGENLLSQTRRLFRQYSRCRDGTISREGLKISLGKTRKKIASLLLRGLECDHAKTSGTCRELYWYRERLWRFLDHAGVEPTNNASERALRHPVIWRKLSFGTQSESGSRFVETMLTIIETCRQQNRNIFEYVTESMTNTFANQPPPSLLPRV
ncbi:MAG: IS66 family transposase, partial [Gimesia sp.]